MTPTHTRNPMLLKPSELRAEIAAILAAALVRTVVPPASSRFESPTEGHHETESGSTENALEVDALSMAPCPLFTHVRQETAR
jgi:hypothetical protein